MKKIEEFDAFDIDGKMYKVIHFKSIKNTGTLDNPHSTMLGMSDYKLSNGESINRISDTEFELLRPQTRIFRK